MSDDASVVRSASPTARAPRVVFIHIPKTGGTTIKQVLSRNVPDAMRLANVFKGGGGRVKEPDYERMGARMRVDANAGFFWGHTPFAIAAYVPPQWETRFITFLRDPVDRAISQYYAMVDRLDGQATDASDNGPAVADASRGAARKELTIRGEFSLDVPYEIALADEAYVSDNLQTRMLCGLPRPFGEVTDEMLERAIENLGRFRCVGLTERFDESLVLLRRRLGYQRILVEHQRVNSSRPRGASVPEELRTAAEQANRFDQELYRHAVAQFDRAPELGDLDFRIDLAALRSSRAGDDTPLPDAPQDLDLGGLSWCELLAERRVLLGGRRRRPRRGRQVGEPGAARPGHRQPVEGSGTMNEAGEDTPKHMKRQRRHAAQQPDAEPGQTALKRERKRHRREQAQRLDAEQEEREPTIAFVHIPKTAGGTLKSVFADAFGREAVHNSGNYPKNPEATAAQSFQFGPRTRITIGHVPYGIYRLHLPPDTRYITFLREPVERVISHYYRHLEGKPGTETLAGALERGTPAVTNLMTRLLCGHGHPEILGALPDTAVEDAKAALESFFFVGFQDRFDESLLILQNRLGMPITAYGASVHVNADRPSFEQVGEENVALIETYNQLDIELFEWARERFGGEFDTHAAELGGAVETFRGAITAKAADQEERTARALQWLTEQVPPGTQRSFKELRAEAEKIGFTTRDLQKARRQMNPPSRTLTTDHGVMLMVLSESEIAERSARRAAKHGRRSDAARKAL